MMDDNDLMPFGKHKGKKLMDVPDDYLIWLYQNITDKEHRNTDEQCLIDYIVDSFNENDLQIP